MAIFREILTILLSLSGFLLSIWILLPSPNMFLFPLTVVAPEISPILLVVNSTVLVLALGELNSIAYLSLFSVCLSLIPVLQYISTSREFAEIMKDNFGEDYEDKIPEAVKLKMRSKIGLISNFSEKSVINQLRITKNIEFAVIEDVKLTLNLYQPSTSGQYPTLVTIYGGAWRVGKPDNNQQFSYYLANQGYTVVAIDYRHAPAYKFPIQLEDIQRALIYIKNHAVELGVDINSVGLMGRSAGAHLATLALRDSPIAIKALVSYYGPVDLIRAYQELPFPDPINIRRVLEDFLGGSPEELPELYQEASPMSYVELKLPPSLLVHPRKDHLVKVEYSREFAERSRRGGNTCIWMEIPWAEHGFDYVFNGLSNQLILYYTERFLAINLGKK